MMLLCAVCMASAANYLTFTAEEDSSSFGIVNKNNNPDVRYSLDDGETWATLAGGNMIILAHKGDKALLKGDNPQGFSTFHNNSTFKMTGKVAASGSVMSLIDSIGLSTEIPNSYCFFELFNGCTSLTKAPELPATTMKERCYADMFYGCTSLTKAPELPAMTLQIACYTNMFSDCASLTQAPDLPATTLASACYAAMFYGCTSLTQAPELSVTKLANTCYAAMFYGCTSLTQAPELPATTLADACYEEMFSGCVNLTQAPELPATTLKDYCYAQMFSDCVSLTRAPKLPATMLFCHCYKEMFMGCTNLSEIDVSFYYWNNGYNSTACWGKNVAPTGTFICPETLPLEFGMDRIPKGWTVKNIINGDTVDVPVKSNCLIFTAEEDGSTFGIVNKDNNPEVQYSLDGGETWTALEEEYTVILAHKGDKALLRGDNPQGFSKGYKQYSTIKMTGKVAVSGNVMSLIDGTGLSEKIPCDYCFYRLFLGCAGLTQAPELPATTLANACYFEMFSDCTSLTQAPELSVTKLANTCYTAMFYGCTSLTQAPELPATTLANECYEKMFSGCVNLTQAPELPATNLAISCYREMFSGCTSLKQTPKLPATALTEGCYNGMFSGCTNLTETAELPATTLQSCCYMSMFRGCTSLTQAPELPATILASECYRCMFSDCTSLTIAPKLSATKLSSYCYMSMFSGCTSLTQAPEISATILAIKCYESMFSGCTSLTQTPALPATKLFDECYASMFSDCTSLTQAPELPATTLAKYCYYRMFSGCTSLTKAPKLSATVLPEGCYYQMFSGCTNLSQINVSFDDWSHNSATFKWVESVAPTGTFICPKTLTLLYGVNEIPEGWTVKYIEDLINYLTFTAEEDNVSVAITEREQDGSDIQPAPYSQRSDESAIASADGEMRPVGRRALPPLSTDLKYSTDGCETWTEMVPGMPITLAKKGDKILFKGNNPSGFSTETQRIQFDIEGKVSASGSVMSLIDEMGAATTIPNEYCFANLFENCAGLTEMPYLIAMELKAYCYKDMFRGCTSLRSTTELPATTLEEGSYEEMFYDCENLSEVAVSFSDWTDGTKDWLHGVASTGKVFSLYNLAPNVGDDYVPEGWMLVTDTITKSADNVFADDIIVWTQDYTIYVKGAKGEISLYDPTGKILLISNSSAEEIRTLKVSSKGVYIVKTNEKSLITAVR